MTELDYLALTVYGEARGEPIEGLIAVGCVIRNRVSRGKWGSTYKDVCLAPAQFSCWQPIGGAINYGVVQAVARQLEAGSEPSTPIWKEIRAVARCIISGEFMDRVNGATHYYAASIATPMWAAGCIPVCKVGNHLFFAGIR